MVTKRGKPWEAAQSWWIVLTFAFGLLTWMAFGYAGVRVGQTKWTLFGVGYLLALVVALSTAISGLGLIIWLAIFVGGILHARAIRAEFLVRLDAQLDTAVLTESVANDRLKGLDDLTAAARQAAVFPSLPEKPTAGLPFESSYASTLIEPSMERIDLNTASEQVISDLLAIGKTDARRIVQQREQQGGFRSMDDFAHHAGLQPHVARKLEPRVQFNPLPYQQQEMQVSIGGRVLD